MTLDEFNRRFRIVDTSLLSLAHDVSKTPKGQPVTGDCQTYAKSVRRILGLPWWRAPMIRCWSQSIIPRHAVLWVPGKGFIDSTTRHFRKTPLPCIPLWPVGTPLLVGLAVAAKVWGLW